MSERETAKAAMESVLRIGQRHPVRFMADVVTGSVSDELVDALVAAGVLR